MVDQFLVAVHEQVQAGAPIVVLHAVRAQGRAKDSEPRYDAIVFAPADQAKRIEVGFPVQIAPVTTRLKVHGFIRGRVVSIGELPATKLTIEEAFGHPEIADALFKRYAERGLLRVKVKMDEMSANPSTGPRGITQGHANRFRWSSATGAMQPLKTGTMCQADIVIERRSLIEMMVPWSRKLGAD